MYFCRCTACVQSRWGCQWCFQENRCATSSYHCSSINFNGSGNNNTTSQHLTLRTLPYINNNNNNVIRQPEYCPSFNRTNLNNNNVQNNNRNFIQQHQLLSKNNKNNNYPITGDTILLPSGVIRQISLPVQNLDNFGNVQFGCIITSNLKIEDDSDNDDDNDNNNNDENDNDDDNKEKNRNNQRHHHNQVIVDAHLVDIGGISKIVCEPTKFEYTKENSTSIATVTAVWNKINFIDQINGKYIIVFEIC